MSLGATELESDTELKFPKEEGFFDQSLAIRTLIGLLFASALFFLFHFQEVRVDVLELNSVADHYLVAQVDFNFLDEEATSILKQEAVRDLGTIYRLQEQDVRETFSNINGKSNDNKQQVSEEKQIQVRDNLQNLIPILLNIRFTDSRTLESIKKENLPYGNYIVFVPLGPEGTSKFSESLWSVILLKTFSTQELVSDAKNRLLPLLGERQWHFDVDIPVQSALRKKIQEKIPDKFTHVTAGSRIIDKGDKVTARHIAMLQSMQQALREKRNLAHPLTLLGSMTLSLLLTGICVVFFRIHYPKILSSNRKLFLLVTIVVLTFALAKGTELFLLMAKHNLIEIVRYPLFVPFSAILICSLLNAGVATFASGFLTIVLTIALIFDRSGFLLMNLAASLVTILGARHLKQRKEIFAVCGYAWLTALIVVVALHLYQSSFWNVGLLTDLITTTGFMLFTAILIVGLLPLFESGFRIMTDVTLMEYMNPNSDLLRRLSIEAPGTYQHSVVVGNLAEAAAVSISANGLFCRVATMYHDIGKMATPQYFTENQHRGMNIHQLLTPLESAQVIMAHISEGVAMARKAGLPEQFIDIIKEHHGTTLVYFFYRKQIEKMGGDATQVNEKDFRYSGPKPRSKESCIIMIADSLEAASRSIETVDEKSINELADRIIKDKADDGQFDRCLITFEELAVVKNTLVKTLVAFSHSRIKYPKRPEPIEGEDVMPSYEA